MWKEYFILFSNTRRPTSSPLQKRNPLKVAEKKNTELMSLLRLRAGRTSFAHTQITNSHVGNKLFFPPFTKLSEYNTMAENDLYRTQW